MGENADLTPPKLVEDALQGKGFNGQPETFSQDADGNITIENPGARFHLLQLKHAIRLEGMGMRHSSGRSALKHAKDTYGLKGNRAAVLSQIEALLERIKAQAQGEVF